MLLPLGGVLIDIEVIKLTSNCRFLWDVEIFDYSEAILEKENEKDKEDDVDYK